jgi:hypothetical protein
MLFVGHNFSITDDSYNHWRRLNIRLWNIKPEDK